MHPCALHQPAALFHPFPSPLQSFPSPDTVPSLLGVTDSSSFRICFPRLYSAHTSVPKPRCSDPHILSQPAPALVPPSFPKSVPKFPSAPHPSIELPVTPPTLPTIPSRVRDEDWGQSIFQWGGELGPAPFVHFCGTPLISASTVFYICSPSTFRLSACGAHSVSPLISTFRPRSATRTSPHIRVTRHSAVPRHAAFADSYPNIAL